MDIQNKQALFALVLQQLEKQLKTSQKNIEKERKAIAEAPTARQSWSDTTRSQKETLLAGLQKEYGQVSKALSTFKNLRVEESETIRPGTVVTIEEAGKRAVYMIVPGLTMKLELSGQTIEVISAASPIARALFRHKAGETVEVRVPRGTRKFKVLGVS